MKKSKVEYGTTDNELAFIGDDKLGLRAYVESMTEFVESCRTPMTVAIQGGWGTGKTSFMRMVSESLKKDKLKIWINTWQYSQFSAQNNLTISFLSSIINEISPESYIDKCKNVLLNLAKPAANITLRAVTSGATETDDFSLGKDLVDYAHEITKLSRDLKEIIDKKIKTESIERIVIFVDDLDRIIPARAVEILEVIKLFFNMPGCVFILALDFNVVHRGIKEKFGLLDGEISDRSFFDKIIQLPFNIPLSQYDLPSFIKYISNESGIDINDKTVNDINLLVKYSDMKNPRAVKRLFNTTQLLLIFSRIKSIPMGPDISKYTYLLFSTQCIQSSFPEVYEYMVNNYDSVNETSFKILAGHVDDQTEKDPIKSNAQSLLNIINAITPKKRDNLSDFFDALLQNYSPNDLVENYQKILRISDLTSSETVASAPSLDPRSLAKNLKAALDGKNLEGIRTSWVQQSELRIKQETDSGSAYINVQFSEEAALISVWSHKDKIKIFERRILDAGIEAIIDADRIKICDITIKTDEERIAFITEGAISYVTDLLVAMNGVDKES